jgi:hypothetical protein
MKVSIPLNSIDMKLHNRFLAICLTVLVAQTPGLTQHSNSQSVSDKPIAENTEEETGNDGFRKVASGSFEMDLDLNIDQKILEADIEMAIDNAMRSIEIVLDDLPIRLEPLEMDFSDLDIKFDAIDISLHDMDIEIEPVRVDLDEIDINIKVDEDDFQFENDYKLNTVPSDHKTIEQGKSESDGDGKNGTADNIQKSKGLKKLN